MVNKIIDWARSNMRSSWAIPDRIKSVSMLVLTWNHLEHSWYDQVGRHDHLEQPQPPLCPPWPLSVTLSQQLYLFFLLLIALSQCNLSSHLSGCFGFCNSRNAVEFSKFMVMFGWRKIMISNWEYLLHPSHRYLVKCIRWDYKLMD